MIVLSTVRHSLYQMTCHWLAASTVSPSNPVLRPDSLIDAVAPANNVGCVTGDWA